MADRGDVGFGKKPVVILRQRIERSLALTERDADGQLRLSFAEIVDGPGLGSTPLSKLWSRRSRFVHAHLTKS
jgi:hypothetical protein